MADEKNLIPAVETTSVEETSKTKDKKTRAPRKPKAVVESVAVSAPVKKTRGRGKKTAASNTPATSVAVTPAAKSSASAKKPAAPNVQPAKRAQQKVGVAPAETDGFAELLKLEEENQKLRKTLSEKLRGENADLRKKLGLI
jgi:putative transposase